MTARRSTTLFAFVSALAIHACGGESAPSRPPTAPPPQRDASDLRRPGAFTAIADRVERSRALFTEASRVMKSPRCVNCHPTGDSPHQGDDGHLHDPPVQRGEQDRGGVALACTSCHQDRNLELARVPGAPGWHLAPRVMAWEGKSPAAICAQVKDPARNGGRSLAALVEHAAHDPLVAWGWEPGAGRTRAPGSQARFAELVSAWVASGAECPREQEERR